LRSLEAEVGPIKYIAALIYGDTIDNTLLENAVRIVILIIVAVFDPLALILIIAAQQSIRWATIEAEEKLKTLNTASEIVHVNKAEDSDNKIAETQTQTIQVETENKVEENLSETVSTKVYNPEKFPYLNKFSHFKDIKPFVYKEKENNFEISETVNTVVVDVAPKDTKIPETAERYKAPMPIVPETLNVRRTKTPEINVRTDFGIAFPVTANKGDSFLRVDTYPNKLYKYNGTKWIQIDKSQSDSHSYDEKYIDFLIEKISTGEYDIEHLSNIEQDLIANKLKSNNENT
jgi:hypothetical protein